MAQQKPHIPQTQYSPPYRPYIAPSSNNNQNNHKYNGNGSNNKPLHRQQPPPLSKRMNVNVNKSLVAPIPS